VVADLRAGLSATRIDTCERAQVERQRPLASVLVSPTEPGGSTFSVDVTDSVTQKRIGRDVDLRDVPEDGRAFALAVAGEELLRASWAELSVRRPPKDPGEKSPPPPEPVLMVPPPPAPERNYSALGLRFSLDHYTEGYTGLGADVFWAQAVVPWLDLGVALGGRRGLAEGSQHGSITGSSVDAELFGEFRLLAGSYHRLDLTTGLRGSHVWFVANAQPGARAKDAAGYAAFAQGGLVLALGAPGFLRSRTRIGLGAPLKSFAVADDGTVVTGLSKLMIFASTGVVWEF
jgi:hypothetical protein